MRRRHLLSYAMMVGVPAAFLFLVLRAGSSLTAPAVSAINAPAVPASPAPLNLMRFILQIVVILVVSRIVGMLFRKIGQPQVIGEMVAGILLGPSLFGWIAPELWRDLFPAGSLGYLNGLSQLGLVLFMFVVGFSLNAKELSGHSHAAVLTSHASIVMPFCLGSALALYLYPRLASAGVSFLSFGLFMGSAMSITAFPVLARILAERNLLRTRIGAMSIACAAVDDVTGWCILASIVMLARASHVSMPAWMTISGALIYVAVMVFGVRRMLMGFEASFHRRKRVTENALTWMVVLALTSAMVTEYLGIHLLFGAFLLGAVMPKNQELVDTVVHQIESVTVVVLLPLFFAFSGLRTSIGMLHGTLWLYTALVIGVAIAGKLGGSMFAARLAGVHWRDAAAIGTLMNTRGLMELIALNIGLDIGVITPAVFTMMVIMALVTTLMTSPLLEWIYPAKRLVHAERPDSQVA